MKKKNILEYKFCMITWKRKFQINTFLRPKRRWTRPKNHPVCYILIRTRERGRLRLSHYVTYKDLILSRQFWWMTILTMCLTCTTHRRRCNINDETGDVILQYIPVHLVHTRALNRSGKILCCRIFVPRWARELLLNSKTARYKTAASAAAY